MHWELGEPGAGSVLVVGLEDDTVTHVDIFGED